MVPIPVQAFASDAAKAHWEAWVKSLKDNFDERWQQHDASLSTEKAGDRETSVKQLTLKPYSTAYDEVQQHLEEDANATWWEYGKSKASDPTEKINMSKILPAKQPVEMLTSLKYTVQVIGAPPKGGYALYIGMHGGGGPGQPNRKSPKASTYQQTYDSSRVSNDGEWSRMTAGYNKILHSGVWVSLRGIGDSWDMHFTRAGYVLVERLITNMTLFGAKNSSGEYSPVNPDRIYLLGFSAGGDGVYRLGMHLPQRFAAVNMGGGHAGDIQFTNAMNMPICLQVGEQDVAYGNRSKTAAEAARALDSLRDAARAWLNDGNAAVYVSDCYIHPTAPDPEQGDTESDDDFEDRVYGHRQFDWESPNFWWQGAWNSDRIESAVIADRAAWLAGFDKPPLQDFLDEEKMATNSGPEISGIRKTRKLNTNPIDWVNQHVRNPMPVNIIWDFFTERAFGPDYSNDNYRASIYNNTSGLLQNNSKLRSDSTSPQGRRQFYWLDIGTFSGAAGGLLPIKARLDKGSNKIFIDQLPLRYLRILLRPEMLADPAKPVTVLMPSNRVLDPVKISWDNPDVLRSNLARNDPAFLFNGDIVLKQSGDVWTVSQTSWPKSVA